MGDGSGQHRGAVGHLGGDGVAQGRGAAVGRRHRVLHRLARAHRVEPGRHGNLRISRRGSRQQVECGHRTCCGTTQAADDNEVGAAIVRLRRRWSGVGRTIDRSRRGNAALRRAPAPLVVQTSAAGCDAKYCRGSYFNTDIDRARRYHGQADTRRDRQYGTRHAYVWGRRTL